nr:hypothetical protein [Hepelivirales sp.]
MSARALYVEPHTTPSPTAAIIQQARLPVFDTAVVEAIDRLSNTLSAPSSYFKGRRYISNLPVTFPTQDHVDAFVPLTSAYAVTNSVWSDLVAHGYINNAGLVLKTFGLNVKVRYFLGDNRVANCTGGFDTSSGHYPVLLGAYVPGNTLEPTVTLRSNRYANTNASVKVEASLSFTVVTTA